MAAVVNYPFPSLSILSMGVMMSSPYDIFDRILGKVGREDKEELAEEILDAEDEIIQKPVDKIFDTVIKEWVPFYGPRGGLGVYNPDTQEREYGHNAQRRLRISREGRKDEGEFIDLGGIVRQILSGQKDITKLGLDELNAVHAYVLGKVKSRGGADPRYKDLSERLQAELSNRGQSPAARTLDQIIGENT